VTLVSIVGGSGGGRKSALFGEVRTFWYKLKQTHLNVELCKMTISQPFKATSESLTLEDIVGCKWSICILALIRQGINRPGAIARSVDGLSTKVQSDCLRKMVSLGLLEKISYPEVPPRVEYELTAIGKRFVTILDELAELQRDVNGKGKVN
jgi:DNA-binding HxlR family transcriptional regulator